MILDQYIAALEKEVKRLKEENKNLRMSRDMGMEIQEHFLHPSAEVPPEWRLKQQGSIKITEKNICEKILVFNLGNFHSVFYWDDRLCLGPSYISFVNEIFEQFMHRYIKHRLDKIQTN